MCTPPPPPKETPLLYFKIVLGDFIEKFYRGEKYHPLTQSLHDKF